MLCIFHIMVICCLLSFGWWFATGLIRWTWCRITGGLVSATGSPQCRGIKCLGNDRPYIGFFTICFSPSASRIDENIHKHLYVHARQDLCFGVGPILWVRTSGHLSKVFLMSVSIAITFPPIPLRAIITYFTSDWISAQNSLFQPLPLLFFPISSCRNCLWREHMSESLWFSWTPTKQEACQIILFNQRLCFRYSRMVEYIEICHDQNVAWQGLVNNWHLFVYHQSGPTSTADWLETGGLPRTFCLLPRIWRILLSAFCFLPRICSCCFLIIAFQQNSTTCQETIWTYIETLNALKCGHIDK